MKKAQRSLNDLVPNLWVRVILLPVSVTVVILTVVTAAMLVLAGKEEKADAILDLVFEFFIGERN